MNDIPQEVLDALLSLREPRTKTKTRTTLDRGRKKCYRCYKSKDVEKLPCCGYTICPNCAEQITKDGKMLCPSCKETITVIFKE